MSEGKGEHKEMSNMHQDDLIKYFITQLYDYMHEISWLRQHQLNARWICLSTSASNIAVTYMYK